MGKREKKAELFEDLLQAAGLAERVRLLLIMNLALKNERRRKKRHISLTELDSGWTDNGVRALEGD